jgi:aryl-alcohol dehydrogenase-like predicted oxidoreductase
MSGRKVTRRDFVKESAMAAGGLALGASALRATETDAKKILNYNSGMEYRRLGKTGLMVSAVCLGGHWKRVDTMVKTDSKDPGWMGMSLQDPGFQKNRYEVVSRCIEVGINYVDACSGAEVLAYSKALEGRRDKMYLGYSWYEYEMRFSPWRESLDKMMEGLSSGLKQARQEYVDLWRISLETDTGKRQTEKEIEITMEALARAKKQGKARFIGVSSHDRVWLKGAVEKYPEQLEVILTPYTAATKVLPQDSLFEAVKKCDVGVFGIKPFASNSLFKGDSSLNSPDAEEDDKRARLAIRHILCNPAVTAPIPGLINIHQVDNAALAVKERRQLDQAEKAELDKAMDEAWAKLDDQHQFLKDWEYV